MNKKANESLKTNVVNDYIYYDKKGNKIFRKSKITICGDCKISEYESYSDKYEKNYIPVLIYNLPEVVAFQKNKNNFNLVYIVEDEETADYINEQKMDQVVATTILGGIYRNDIRYKDLEIFKNKGAVVVSKTYETPNRKVALVEKLANNWSNYLINLQVSEIMEKENICEIIRKDIEEKKEYARSLIKFKNI